MLTLAESPAREAYEALAPVYDTLTRDYPYERWLTALERLAVGCGLRGSRLLDVACGTGKSFMPLLRRGYEVVACDISPAMVAEAVAKAPEAELVVADMRALGRLGEFDLVTCIDDSLNYLLCEDDLAAALRGFRENLAPGGLAVWDTNSPAMYRTAFASDWVAEAEDCFIAWKGLAGADFAAGGTTGAQVDVFLRAGTGWERTTSFHQQRHWPVAEVRAAAARAGLEIVATRGQRRGAVLDDAVDEHVHTKVVFVAARDDRHRPPRGGER